MYTLVRRFIKTGILFLFAGLILGAWMLVRRELLGVWPHPYLVSAHAHAVLVGFVMFMILGVALWLFPRAEKDDQRYRPERIEAAYWTEGMQPAFRIAEAPGLDRARDLGLAAVAIPHRGEPNRRAHEGKGLAALRAAGVEGGGLGGYMGPPSPAFVGGRPRGGGTRGVVISASAGPAGPWTPPTWRV